MDDKNIFDEKELDEFMSDLNKIDISVPDELENRIIERVKASKINKGYGKKIAISFLITMLLFVGGVRFNDDFAAYASKIEILKPIVDFIRYGDKGIEKAYENGYKKMDGVTYEENGYVVNIDDILVDEDRVYMTVKISGDKIKDIEDKEGLLIKTEFKSHRFSGYYGFPNKTYFDHDTNTRVTEVELHFNDIDFAKKILDDNDLEMKIDLILFNYESKEKNLIQEFAYIKIPLQKDNIKKSKIYNQNKDIEFEYGKIRFNKLVISPTRMYITYETKMKDGYTFEDFEKFYLKDDKGNIYEHEGLRGSGRIENQSLASGNIYFVPSIYFEDNDVNLYLCIEGLRYMKLDDKTVTLSKSDLYPKTIKYFEYDITFNKPIKNEDGNLVISYYYDNTRESYNYFNLNTDFNLKKVSLNKTEEILEDKITMLHEYIYEVLEGDDDYKFYISSAITKIQEKHIEINLKTKNYY